MPIQYETVKCGDASKTRKARLCCRERTNAYVTKTKRKPDEVLRRIYAFYLLMIAPLSAELTCAAYRFKYPETSFFLIGISALRFASSSSETFSLIE